MSAVVVLAGRTYAVERDWPAPLDLAAGPILSQVAVDTAGRVHLLQRSPPKVLVFEPDGRFAYSYGENIADGHGITADAEGRILVTDRDSHQVICFRADGCELFRLGERHRPRWQEPFNHPTDVSVAPDGRIFVADGYGNARVHRFAADGTHELSWGSLGREPGAFMTPHAVWAMRDGRVLVADRENGRIAVYDREGSLIAIWGGLENPMDIFVDAADRVYVTDQIPSLVLYSPEGELLGRCRPSLNGAHGIFGNAAGDLFLAEMNPPSLTRLRLLD